MRNGSTLDAEYVFESLTPAHYPLLQQLFREAFNMKISIADIGRRFHTEPLGSPVIGFIAIHRASNEPAAYYGVFPLQLVSGGKKIAAAQSGDTMTHPGHRRKGLFIRLAELTYAACRARNINVIYGSPNKNSYRGLMKLGWAHVEDILRRDLKPAWRTLPVGRLAQRFRFMRSAHLAYIRFFLRRKTVTGVNDFTNAMITTYARVQRDGAYLAYKSSRDKLFVRVGECTLWLKFADVMWIGDVDYPDKITQRDIRKLMQYAFMLGYNTIRFYLNASVSPPEAMKSFTITGKEASCIFHGESNTEPFNILLTGADFDTF